LFNLKQNNNTLAYLYFSSSRNINYNVWNREERQVLYTR